MQKRKIKREKSTRRKKILKNYPLKKKDKKIVNLY